MYTLLYTIQAAAGYSSAGDWCIVPADVLSPGSMEARSMIRSSLRISGAVTAGRSRSSLEAHRRRLTAAAGRETTGPPEAGLGCGSGQGLCNYGFQHCCHRYADINTQRSHSCFDNLLLSICVVSLSSFLDPVIKSFDDLARSVCSWFSVQQYNMCLVTWCWFLYLHLFIFLTKLMNTFYFDSKQFITKLKSFRPRSNIIINIILS